MSGSRLKAIVQWLARLRELAQFELRPTSRVAYVLRLCSLLVAIFLVNRVLVIHLRELTHAQKPRAVPTVTELDGTRFGLSLQKRKAVFADMAKIELRERERAIRENTWQGHLWSREDDLGWVTRVGAREMSPLHGVDLTDVALIMDEGIREHWLAPNGEPLPATTPPHNPRQVW